MRDYSRVRFTYVYAVARDDDFRFAVGMQFSNGHVDGSVALFRDRDEAMMFVDFLRAKHGVTVEIMPSAA